MGLKRHGPYPGAARHVTTRPGKVLVSMHCSWFRISPGVIRTWQPIVEKKTKSINQTHSSTNQLIKFLVDRDVMTSSLSLLFSSMHQLLLYNLYSFLFEHFYKT